MEPFLDHEVRNLSRMESNLESSSPAIEATSAPYLGRWQRLVSTTNWEKGRIILEWRSALVAATAPAAEYSDDAWSRRVNNVSGQHVGRLRRVYERFGATFDQYAGLYWSHFQTALDWNDAEMWLEGAVQNEWSVAQMRRQRWDTLQLPEEETPFDADLANAEFDEDIDHEGDSGVDRLLEGRLETVQPHDADAESVESNSRQDGEDAEDERNRPDASEWEETATTSAEPPALIQPFANIPTLPHDLQEAFELFKTAILRHRLTHWNEVARGDVVSSLDALKEFALAPVETSA